MQQLLGWLKHYGCVLLDTNLAMEAQALLGQDENQDEEQISELRAELKSSGNIQLDLRQ